MLCLSETVDATDDEQIQCELQHGDYSLLRLVASALRPEQKFEAFVIATRLLLTFCAVDSSAYARLLTADVAAGLRQKVEGSRVEACQGGEIGRLDPGAEVLLFFYCELCAVAETRVEEDSCESPISTLTSKVKPATSQPPAIQPTILPQQHNTHTFLTTAASAMVPPSPLFRCASRSHDVLPD